MFNSVQILLEVFIYLILLPFLGIDLLVDVKGLICQTPVVHVASSEVVLDGRVVIVHVWRCISH